MSTSLAKTFSAAGVSLTYRIGRAEQVTYTLSGTYAATLQLEMASTPDESSWVRVAGPFSTANASVTGVLTSPNVHTRYRWNCTAYTSGNAVTNLVDGVRSSIFARDQYGNPTITFSDDEVILDRGFRAATSLASGPPVPCIAATLTIDPAIHAGRTVVLDLAAGIAVTLPAATGTGNKYRFIVKTTFTGAASIKSLSGADIMLGHALMGNNSDNTVVDWQAIASNTYDTIDMLGTANSTGGLAGEEINLEDVATNVWFVNIRGDAAGTEATPFTDTVA